nr:hypothetical protein [Tanacetum cinerariifolium]
VLVVTVVGTKGEWRLGDGEERRLLVVLYVGATPEGGGCWSKVAAAVTGTKGGVAAHGGE